MPEKRILIIFKCDCFLGPNPRQKNQFEMIEFLYADFKNLKAWSKYTLDTLWKPKNKNSITYHPDLTWATIWTSSALFISMASIISTLWQVTCSKRVPDLRKLKLVLSESMWILSSWFRDRHRWLYRMASGSLQLLPPDTEIQKLRLILISFCWFRSAIRWTTSFGLRILMSAGIGAILLHVHVILI